MEKNMPNNDDQEWNVKSSCSQAYEQLTGLIAN